jgi:pyruvate carboxylase
MLCRPGTDRTVADVATRFQKMVELAPSTIQNRELVGTVIESAVNLAKSVGDHILPAKTGVSFPG